MNNLLKQHSNRLSGGKRDGFTLIEMVVVIAVIALLAAIVTPLAISVIKDARISKAAGDAASMAKAIQRYRIDTGVYPFVNQATETTAQFAVLSTTGGSSPTATGSVGWSATNPENYAGSGSCDGTPGAPSSDQNLFSNHLLDNGPTFTVPTNPRKSGWKGTYVSELDEDPWGNKYLSNIGNASDGCSFGVYVLSAGPNGIVETAYDLALTGTAAGDDVIARIR